MLTLKDRSGRSVRLSDERLAHILDHPEMIGLEHEIQRTLERPQRVIRSASDPLVELSCRQRAKTMVGDKLLCVVVKYLDADAFVITAYLTDQEKKGTILWTES